MECDNLVQSHHLASLTDHMKMTTMMIVVMTMMMMEEEEEEEDNWNVTILHDHISSASPASLTDQQLCCAHISIFFTSCKKGLF